MKNVRGELDNTAHQHISRETSCYDSFYSHSLISWAFSIRGKPSCTYCDTMNPYILLLLVNYFEFDDSVPKARYY